MLRWYVEDDVAFTAVKNPEQLIVEEEVEIRPEKFPKNSDKTLFF